MTELHRRAGSCEDEEQMQAMLQGSSPPEDGGDRLGPSGRRKEPLQLTLRASVVGVFVGSILCFTNMYFGLQTGWVTMGSVQCAVVGFVLFRTCLPRSSAAFTAHENVVVQTVGVATATMPLAAGFVGIIPALKMLVPPEGPNGICSSASKQIVWAAALCYFGIFFAVPLRRQTILVEQLRFPSGTATAKLIEVLHGATDDSSHAALHARWQVLFLSFAASFSVSLLAYFVPYTANLPVGTWLCLPDLTAWRWTLRPSLSYMGQGMIMGLRPALSTLVGAVLSWGVLGPLALRHRWVEAQPTTGVVGTCEVSAVSKTAVESWEHGAQGWVLWVALALMLGEALTAFALTMVRQCMRHARSPALLPANANTSPSASDASESDAPEIPSAAVTPRGLRGGRASAASRTDPYEVAPPSELVPTSWWAGGLAASTILAVAVISPLFDMPAWQTLAAVMMSCLIAVLAVRALGQTDLNPVSAVGKISQIVFAVLAPGHVVANVVAGAVAEAGAMQVGDLMQDLKTGHLLAASPRAQFWAQLIGSTASVFITVGAYQMYTSLYTIPSDQFQVPGAYVWKDMAELMQLGPSALPPTAKAFAGYFGAAGVALPILEAGLPESYATFLPSGISVGVGMYLSADWTLPRVAGALTEWIWRQKSAATHERYMLMVASGFVLGEGVMSILALFLTAMHVPRFV